MIARHNNVIVSIQRVDSRAEARALADQIRSLRGAEAEIEEVADPAETDLTTVTREISDRIGWRRADDHEPAEANR